jgi:hypothetical protein
VADPGSLESPTLPVLILLAIDLIGSLDIWNTPRPEHLDLNVALELSLHGRTEEFYWDLASILSQYRLAQKILEHQYSQAQ